MFPFHPPLPGGTIDGPVLARASGGIKGKPMGWHHGNNDQKFQDGLKKGCCDAATVIILCNLNTPQQRTAFTDQPMVQGGST